MRDNLGVLIVGAGKIGTIRAQIVRELHPKFKLYVFDTNKSRASKLAKEVNGKAIDKLSNALKNSGINIVVVSVINKYSKQICVSAINRGKNVLCEKPMGTNYKEALEIYKAVEKYKRKFKCGFNHRYHPAIREAYKLYKEGRIGKLLFIRAAYGHGGRKGYEKEWRAKKTLSGGGELLDQGSHLIDLCHWFFGFEKIKRYHCISKALFWKMEADDNAFALLETKSGKVAQLHASWTQWKNLFRFEIYGTKGAIKINGLGGNYGIETLKVFTRLRLGEKPKVIEEQFKGYDESWKLEWLDFIESIGSDKLPMSNHIESLSVMKTIDKLYNQ